MTTQEIADRLVELCRQGKNAEAYQELFSKNAVAVEPSNVPNPKTEGLDALLQKAQQFGTSLQELHDSWVSDPLVAGNYFTVAMGLDATFKEQGRMKMDEVCLYEVKDGKIVKEQFFF